MNDKKQQSRELSEDSLFEEFDNLSLEQIRAGKVLMRKLGKKASQINLDNLNRLKDPQNLEDLDS